MLDKNWQNNNYSENSTKKNTFNFGNFVNVAIIVDNKNHYPWIELLSFKVYTKTKAKNYNIRPLLLNTFISFY